MVLESSRLFGKVDVWKIDIATSKWDDHRIGELGPGLHHRPACLKNSACTGVGDRRLVNSFRKFVSCATQSFRE